MFGHWLHVVLLGAAVVMIATLPWSALTRGAPIEPPWETWPRWDMVVAAFIGLEATDDSLSPLERWARGLFAGAWILTFVFEALRWKIAKYTPSNVEANKRE